MAGTRRPNKRTLKLYFESGRSKTSTRMSIEKASQETRFPVLVLPFLVASWGRKYHRNFSISSCLLQPIGSEHCYKNGNSVSDWTTSLGFIYVMTKFEQLNLSKFPCQGTLSECLWNSLSSRYCTEASTGYKIQYILYKSYFS